jgi:hypothetical protein
MTAGDKIRKRRLELENRSDGMRLGNGVLLDSKGKFLCRTVDKSCSNCKWHDRFSWVCCNGMSECKTYFAEPDYVCKDWEKKDDNRGENQEAQD